MSDELGEDLRTAAVRTAPDSDEPVAYELVVIEGDSANARLTIDGTEPTPLLVGTGPTSSLRLGDPLVSRRHLRLCLEGRWLRISDVGSTNGTFVDGVRLVDGFLRGGEIVRIGHSALRVDTVTRRSSRAEPFRDRFGRLPRA